MFLDIKKSREFDIKMAKDGYENPFWRDHELFRRFNRKKSSQEIKDKSLIRKYRR